MINHTLRLGTANKRHLIVGDIHGYFEKFLDLLEKAEYDPDNDVLYSVGDMIDRGPQSVEVFHFFRDTPNCYAVKGNHELMLLDEDWYSTWITNGGLQTIKNIQETNTNIDQLKKEIDELPWVIEVGHKFEEHSFRIIHAEVPPSWSDVFLGLTLQSAQGTNDPSFRSCIWSRRLIRTAEDNIKNSLPAAHGVKFDPERNFTNFVGHTPTHQVFQCGDHWFLDTSYAGKLSMIDAETKEVFSIDLFR